VPRIRPFRPATCHRDRQHHAKGFCRECYYRQWETTPGAREKQRAGGIKYYWSHREQALQRAKARWEKYPAEERSRRLKARALKARYGLTLEDYAQMIVAQNGRCAICEQPFRVIDVDHDHSTGAVRGLLCRACNLGIAFFEKHAELAARYLAPFATKKAIG